MMSITGLNNFNQNQQLHGEPSVSYGEYIISGNFIESIAENKESEFLQMFFYIIFTAFLYQKGSSESKKLSGDEPVDRDPKKKCKEGFTLACKKRGTYFKAL